MPPEISMQARQRRSFAEVLARNPSLRVNRGSLDLANKRPVRHQSDGQGDSSNPAIQPARGGKAAQHSPKTDYKAMLVQQCEIAGLKLEPEFKFLADRKFRADWRVHFGMWEGKRQAKIETFIPSNVLVEYEGGIFSSGKRGHSSVAGIQRDIEKSNLAQIAGFIVIRVTPKHVVSGEAFSWIMDALKERNSNE